jgi:hypothetical protein
MNYQKIIEIALPFLAYAVSAALQKDSLSTAANAIIATSTIVLTAILAAFLNGQLTGNIVTDVVIISGIAVTFQKTYFASFDTWLVVHLFPSSQFRQSKNALKSN